MKDYFKRIRALLVLHEVPFKEHKDRIVIDDEVLMTKIEPKSEQINPAMFVGVPNGGISPPPTSQFPPGVAPPPTKKCFCGCIFTGSVCPRCGR
jgi:hypothetical protein